MKCKVGDLVVVSGVRSLEHPANLGRFGTITNHATELVPDAMPGIWYVVPQNTFVGREYGKTVYFESDKKVAFWDSSLTPIRPGDLVEDTETEKQLEQA